MLNHCLYTTHFSFHQKAGHERALNQIWVSAQLCIVQRKRLRPVFTPLSLSFLIYKMGLIIIPVLSTSLDCPEDQRSWNVNFKVLCNCELTVTLLVSLLQRNEMYLLFVCMCVCLCVQTHVLVRETQCVWLHCKSPVICNSNEGFMLWPSTCQVRQRLCRYTN